VVKKLSSSKGETVPSMFWSKRETESR
jgi:hypothetical protein